MSDDHVEEVAAEEVEVEEEAPMSVLDALKEVRRDLFSLDDGRLEQYPT
jgi:succinate dehydrogenase/fumarate reductase-like Fe-S protein